MLGALGSGARRRSRVASRAQQRIDYTLARLARAGYVRAVRPHGAPPGTDPLYEMADPYLAFWFSVLREDADLIEGGQGAAVQKRVAGRWQTHLGRVFEEAAREHAVRLVATEQLPAEMTIGHWWRDEIAEIDVLGLLEGQTRLIGEAKWQSRPPHRNEIQAMRAKLGYLPESHPDLELAFWTRGGPSVAVRGAEVIHFTAADMV